MLDRLPEYIDPVHLADTRGELKGKIPLNSLDRLVEMLVNDTGTVNVNLVFGREGKLVKVEGHLETVLELECQNCLEAIKWPVDCTIKLGIVTSIYQADRLPGGYEPLLVEEERISLKNLIEDEILLILPSFPKHQHACFVSKFEKNNVVPLGNDKHLSRENPFSILAKLKNTGDL